MNPLTPLYARCNTGSNAAKLKALPGFPRLIDVEMTNACNFRCLMCPTGNLAMTRASGFMSGQVWERFLSECMAAKPALRFIGWGEPLLHPHIADFVRQAAAADMLTHINTNGSKLTGFLMKELIEAGLSSIKFSFQGVDRESYREMRNTDFFEGLYETVEMFHRLRAGHDWPYIHVSTTTTHESAESIEAFREMFAPITDQVSVGKTIFSHMDMNAVRLRPEEKERLERLSVFEPELHHPVPCPEVYDKLTMQWDGSVRVCCNDFDGVTDLGNVLDRPLGDIWRDKTIQDYRKRLAADEYEGPLCGNCWDYQGLSAG